MAIHYFGDDWLRVIFDTNAFDEILIGKDLDLILKAKSKGWQFYVTHIQRDELASIPDPNDRDALLALYKSIGQEFIPTESAVVGVSRVGGCKLGDGKRLESLRKGNPAHTKDALIVETAIKNGLVLVTQETRLPKTARKEGCEVMSYKEFKKMLLKEIVEDDT